MKKIFLTFVVAALVVLPSSAQQKWSLEQCIDYAVENNIELRQTALGVESAQVALNTSRHSRLPNLSAGMNQSFSFGRSISDDTNEYVNTQSSNSSMSLSTGLPIFQGFRINHQIAQDKIDLASAVENLEKARQSLELNIARLYLDVLLRKEVLQVYREQTALMRKQVENTVTMVEEGSAAPSRLYDIRAQLAQREVSEVGAENDLAAAILNLTQALNLRHTEGFDIEVPDDIEPTAFDLAALSSPDQIYQTALGVKPQVREAELRLASSNLQVKIAKASFWPSINMSASFGDGYYYMFGQDFPQKSFIDQLRDKRSQSVGLSMNIPIFNRNSTRNNVRSARINATISSLSLDGVRQTLYKEIQQAYQGAVAAGARYRATLKALEAAQESFRAMELRYENDKATAYEYSEANTNLLTSLSERAQAKYNYLFCAKILDFYNGKPIEL